MARCREPIAALLWLCVIAAASTERGSVKKRSFKDQLLFGSAAVAAIENSTATAKIQALSGGSNSLANLLMRDQASGRTVLGGSRSTVVVGGQPAAERQQPARTGVTRHRPLACRSWATTSKAASSCTPAA